MPRADEPILPPRDQRDVNHDEEAELRAIEAGRDEVEEGEEAAADGCPAAAERAAAGADQQDGQQQTGVGGARVPRPRCSVGERALKCPVSRKRAREVTTISHLFRQITGIFNTVIQLKSFGGPEGGLRTPPGHSGSPCTVKF